jgi:hypothetical protein
LLIILGACLAGLRERLHGRLRPEPCQTLKTATAPGVELGLEPLAASTEEAEPRKRGSMRLRLIFTAMPPVDATGWWRSRASWERDPTASDSVRARRGGGWQGGSGSPRRDKAVGWKADGGRWAAARTEETGVWCRGG